MSKTNSKSTASERGALHGYYGGSVALKAEAKLMQLRAKDELLAKGRKFDALKQSHDELLAALENAVRVYGSDLGEEIDIGELRAVLAKVKGGAS